MNVKTSFTDAKNFIMDHYKDGPFNYNSYNDFKELMIAVDHIKNHMPDFYAEYIVPIVTRSLEFEVANRFGIAVHHEPNNKFDEKFLNDHYRTRFTANDINMKWRRKYPLGGDYLTRYLIENDISKVKNYKED